MTKSFYQDLLFEHFPDYKTKRLCRVNKSRLLGDLCTIARSFPNTSLHHTKVGEYMFCALRPNDANFVTTDTKLIEEVKSYFECISKYSHRRLNSVFQTNFGQIIFELIVSHDNYLNKLLDSNTLAKKNRSVYEKGLKRFQKGFKLE